MDFKAPAGAEQFRHLVILPIVDIVKRAFLNETLGRVSLVVQYDYDRIELLANRRGQLHTGHLKCTIADQDQRTKLAIGDLHSNARRNRKAHRSVIRSAQKLSVLSNRKISSGEQRIPGV